MDGKRGLVYAVGDVHGHADKLLAVHDAIRRDLRRHPARHALLVHLGDYIDRGPDSAECLELVASPRSVPGVPVVNLMGNHEAMLLAALDRHTPGAAGHWIENGGDMTLESWGIDPDSPEEQWERQMPPWQLAFLRRLAVCHVAEGFAFVHAGVRPGVPLARQHADDMLWIREGFLEWDGVMLPEAPALTIVHGHTPTPLPDVRSNRIGVDTGAGAGGRLTCAVLSADPPRFLQA